MVTSLYNPCLLITTEKETFGVVGIQIDNTLFLGLEKFATLKDNKLKANFNVKPRNELSLTSDLIFNGCILTQALDNTMTLIQKDQGKKLQLINTKEGNSQQWQYVEQCARGAYIALICQPKVLYDLSMAV
jgi:hypothetical protein